jgi:hypothetical protein
MGSQQPSFQQRSGPVSQGQQVFSGLGGADAIFLAGHMPAMLFPGGSVKSIV